MDESIEFLYWKLKQHELDQGSPYSFQFFPGKLVRVKDADWLEQHQFSADTCFKVRKSSAVYDNDIVIGYVCEIVEKDETYPSLHSFLVFEYLLEYHEENKRG